MTLDKFFAVLKEDRIDIEFRPHAEVMVKCGCGAEKRITYSRLFIPHLTLYGVVRDEVILRRGRNRVMVSGARARDFRLGYWIRAWSADYEHELAGGDVELRCTCISVDESWIELEVDATESPIKLPVGALLLGPNSISVVESIEKCPACGSSEQKLIEAIKLEDLADGTDG